MKHFSVLVDEKQKRITMLYSRSTSNAPHMLLAAVISRILFYPPSPLPSFFCTLPSPFALSEAICDHDEVSGISVIIMANKQDLEVSNPVYLIHFLLVHVDATRSGGTFAG